MFFPTLATMQVTIYTVATLNIFDVHKNKYSIWNLPVSSIDFIAEPPVVLYSFPI
jgi:hypothetical protein